jgi:hypothetical protein
MRQNAPADAVEPPPKAADQTSNCEALADLVPTRTSPLAPLPLLPGDPAAALAVLRSHGCRLWVADGRFQVAPTWRVPPAAVARLLTMAPKNAMILQGESG